MTAYSGGTISFTGKNKYIIPGGKSYGVGAFGSFSVTIYKNLSAGFQLSSALLHYKIGGNTSEETWVYEASGNLNSYTNITRETILEQIVVSRSLASLNISIGF